VRWQLLALALLGACHAPHPGAGAGADSSLSPPHGDAAVTSVDAGPCGLRTGMRGMTSRTLSVAGLTRTYIVYLPEGDPQTPMPLVFVHHGYTMSGSDMYQVTGYPALADSDHIALAFPDGQAGPNSLGAPWNVGSNVCPSLDGSTPDATGDDFAFLDAMKADIAQDQCLDTAHEFLTGFSMGGYFAHHVGCMRDDIRAVAPHSGGTHTFETCTTGHKPVIIFHGLADPLIPDGCDDPGGSTPSGFTASATQWAVKNACGSTTHTISVDNGSCQVWDGCPADGQVELCTFNLMGHCWAGGQGLSLYACNDYASATQLEWQFFQQYAW
jgi:polyhydroxybutyrate depolymerase